MMMMKLVRVISLRLLLQRLKSPKKLCSEVVKGNGNRNYPTQMANNLINIGRIDLNLNYRPQFRFEVRIEHLQSPKQDVASRFEKFEVLTSMLSNEERAIEVVKWLGNEVFNEYLQIEVRFKNDYREIKAHILNSLKDSRRNVLTEFFTTSQQPGESIEKFAR